MSVPVINTTTSVLGYKQWEAWTYQPYATNSPTSWACPNLPAGLSIDTPVQYAATGVASTDVITATGNTFVNGSQVLLPSLTGGAGLVANTIYFVRGDVQTGGYAWRYGYQLHDGYLGGFDLAGAFGKNLWRGVGVGGFCVRPHSDQCRWDKRSAGADNRDRCGECGSDKLRI